MDRRFAQILAGVHLFETDVVVFSTGVESIIYVL